MNLATIGDGSTEDASRVERRFTFDLRVYRLAAIKKAAYRFAGDFAINIAVASETDALVCVRPLPTNGGRRRRSLDDFEREVLDQELREVVAAETGGVRDLLIAQAFSATSLLDPVGEHASAADDPLRIRNADVDRRGD